MWTSNNIIGMNVVTAGARLVRASSEENRALFWRLRGGGGNFGVVAGIDYVLNPDGPEIVEGLAVWPASEAAGVLDLYRTLAEKAPAELTLVVIMRKGKDYNKALGLYEKAEQTAPKTTQKAHWKGKQGHILTGYSNSIVHAISRRMIFLSPLGLPA